MACGGRDTAATEAAVKELSALGRIEGYTLDMLKDDEVERMIDYVAEKYGRIDVLVNNAGICPRTPALEMDNDEWMRAFDLDARAYYVAMRCAARYMIKQGGCNMVCVSSTAGTNHISYRSAYSAAKAAVNGMVGTLAVEWGRFGIRVNAVAPGFVLTDLVQKGIDEGRIDMENNMKILPIKRLIETREVAEPVVFLASDHASAITGTVLNIDLGGTKAALIEAADLK